QVFLDLRVRLCFPSRGSIENSTGLCHRPRRVTDATVPDLQALLYGVCGSVLAFLCFSTDELAPFSRTSSAYARFLMWLSRSPHRARSRGGPASTRRLWPSVTLIVLPPIKTLRAGPSGRATRDRLGRATLWGSRRYLAGRA